MDLRLVKMCLSLVRMCALRKANEGTTKHILCAGLVRMRRKYQHCQHLDKKTALFHWESETGKVSGSKDRLCSQLIIYFIKQSEQDLKCCTSKERPFTFWSLPV